MAGKGAIMISLFVFLSMLLLLSKPVMSDDVTKVDCGKVVADVRPCTDYVTGKSDKPSKECCSGLKKLKDLVKEKEDRQATCECIKKATADEKVDASRVLGLPAKCGVSIYLPASYSPAVDVDCKTVF